MPEVIRKVLNLLSPKERKQAKVLVFMILIMALLDVIGIASIMPFMAVLANPGVVQSNDYLKATYEWVDLGDTERFLFFLGVVVFAALLISIAFKALTTWAITTFTQMRNYSISQRLVAGYLGQSYEWFLNRHSADLGKAALSEVQIVVQGALIPLMHVIAQGTVVSAILILLIVVDPKLAIVVGAGMGGAYALTYVALRRFLGRIGKERVTANEQRFKVLSEAFGGIKELKLIGMENDALARFDSPARKFAKTQALAKVAGLLPKYALEAVAFGGMLVLVLFLMRKSDGLQGALPILGLYALAGYRLMPALQLAYNNATTLRFSTDALTQLQEDFERVSKTTSSMPASKEAVGLENCISLKDVSYNYPGADRPAVERMTLQIPARTTVGFVGSTGSGKTTTVDIILGLLEPGCGSLSVDGVSIQSENRRAWQMSLGYVPQQIYLSDESVASNVAFGVSTEQIDYEAVEKAARIANLHEFVMNDLPNSYDTLVGERGVRLSGGQRQRIGIARALYRRPKVLILDEATSALDNLTEQAVMDAVHNLSGEITIILIAHRLGTVRDCDRIFVLEQGQLVGEGTYDELKASNERFRAMAGGQA